MQVELPSFPLWIKTVFGVAAAVMGIIGLAGVPDDVKRWFRWLRNIGRWTRQGVPWWVLLVFSLGILTYLWFPYLWWAWGIASLFLPIVAWRAGVARNESGDTLLDHGLNANERLASATDTEIKTLEGHNRTHRGEVSRLKEQVAAQQDEILEKDRETESYNEVVELTAELERERHQAMELRERMRQESTAHLEGKARLEEQITILQEELKYGVTYYLQFDELESFDAKLALSRVEEIVPTISKACDGALEIMRQIGQAMQMGGKETCGYWLGAFISDNAWKPLNRVHDKLKEEVAAHRDPRKWLVYFYDRYNQLRHWIKTGAELWGSSLVDAAKYSEWRGHDQRFFDELSRITAINQLSKVQEWIESINEDHNYPETLPD